MNSYKIGNITVHVTYHTNVHCDANNIAIKEWPDDGEEGMVIWTDGTHEWPSPVIKYPHGEKASVDPSYFGYGWDESGKFKYDPDIYGVMAAQAVVDARPVHHKIIVWFTMEPNGEEESNVLGEYETKAAADAAYNSAIERWLQGICSVYDWTGAVVAV